MRKIIVSAFVSLDGVMQAPGGPEEDTASDFRFGGWVAPHFDEAVGAAMGEVFSRPYDLLLGRKTYDIFAAHWSKVTKPDAADIEIARAFNSAVKYVATRGTPALPWETSVSLGPDVVASLKNLKAGDGPDLLVQGSSDFLQTLWSADLVDELTTLTFPVVLGSGKRLFESGAAPRGLKLETSAVSPSGVVVARYTPAGTVATGDFTQQE